MSELTEGTIRRIALRITAVYVAVTGLWIVFSDRIAAGSADGAGLRDDVQALTRVQTIKGLSFVAFTGAMLFLLIRGGLRRAMAAEDTLLAQREVEAVRYRELVSQSSGEAAQAHEARQRLEEQLRQSQKMEAIGLLAGGVAHDFNNLLVAMSGYAELALGNVPAESPAREEIEGIRQAVERGAGLTRQLLALSRRQVLEPAPLELNAVILDLGRMLPRVLGGRLELSIRTEANPSTVLADLSQMEQLVLNLCVNARDAMPEGGRLLVQTENVRPLGAEAATPGSGRRVALIVTDTGTGMDAATRERIFEPFFTTKPVGQGTGLGLSTVYAIVQQSAGTIACSSAPGRGTSFRIELPLFSAADADAGAGADMDGEPAPDVLAHGTETVLLVDDDACSCEISERALARHGYTVFTAAELPGGQLAAAARGGPLDIVIASAHLTGGAGDGALRRLHASHPALTLLLVTSREHMLQSTPTPGTAMLAMPFTPLELATAVRRALDQSTASAAATAATAASAARAGTAASAGAAATAGAATRDGGQAQAPAPGEPHRLAVLVVDDDIEVCRVVREMLESAGHSVHMALHGTQALALLHAKAVDVVLCDMLMPEKEGLETCGEIRRRFPGLPFIAMSGAPGGSNYMRIAVRLGAAGSLAKPFNRQDLLAALDRALSVRQGW